MQSNYVNISLAAVNVVCLWTMYDNNRYDLHNI